MRFKTTIKTYLWLMLLFGSIIMATDANAGTYSGGNGSLGTPYQIANITDLIELSTTTADWAAGTYFIQTADIDASATSSLNDGAGFSPIGKGAIQFQGHYNGQNHTITNLYIDRSDMENIGLFGFTMNGATISNIGVVSCNITGGNQVGGLVGINRGSSINNSYSTGSVSGKNNVGGLVGQNFLATISNSYSLGNVTRFSGTETYIGGLVGTNFSSTIQYCYSTGKVYSSVGTIWNVGSNKDKGFVGYNNGGTYTNNFFDSEASEQTDDCYNATTATAKTTALMKTQATFTGWDFATVPIWKIDAKNNGYPYLAWQTFRPDNPSPFAAAANSTTQIDLSWTLNVNSNPVLLAYNTTNTFGAPTGTYSAGNSITGGGTVLSVGDNTSFNHTTLTVNTHYYYKIWSKDGSNVYSSGATDDEWTLANVPSAPTVTNPSTGTSLNLAINANANPAATEFAIRTAGQYVQANGSLGAGEVWQTALAWGTIEVTSLTTGVEYTFDVKAKNGNNVETAFGATATGTPVAHPTTQASGIEFSNITRNSITVRWSNGNGEKRLLLGRERYSIPSNPLTDGVSYAPNPNYTSATTVSGAKVLYNNTGTSVTVSGLTRYSLVYFKVIEYNEPTPGNTLYLQADASGNPRSRWTLRRDGMMEEDLTIDAEYAYPNPASYSISTTLDMFEAGTVSAKLYDAAGRVAAELYNQSLPFGTHELKFDISSMPSGVYQLIIAKGSEAIVYPVSVVR